MVSTEERLKSMLRVSRQRLTWAGLRDNLAILPVAAYSAGISAYYLLYGISADYTLALVCLAGAIAAVALGMMKKVNMYWVSIVSIMLSYEGLQGVVGTLVYSRSVLSLYSLDRQIWGFNLTGWVQSTFSSSAVTALASFFYSLHFPLIVATCVTIWFTKRALISKYITAMILTSYSALVTFILFPTSPPWYSGVAVNLYQNAMGTVFPQGFMSALSLVEVDKLAAFPSLHGAYAVIFSYFMIKIDRRLALISIPITAGILFSTIYLGQHYLIDLIGGAVYALVPCLIAERFQLRIPGAKLDAK